LKQYVLVIVLSFTSEFRGTPGRVLWVGCGVAGEKQKGRLEKNTGETITKNFSDISAKDLGRV